VRKRNRPLIETVHGQRGISAAKFNAHCLAWMDEVERTGRALVVTKHGRPVARLTTAAAGSAPPLFGRMRGSITVRGDLVAPIGPDWRVDEDL